MLEKLDEKLGYVDGDMVIPTYLSYGDDGRLTIGSIKDYAMFELNREYVKAVDNAEVQTGEGYTVECTQNAITWLGLFIENMEHDGDTFGTLDLADGTLARDVPIEDLKSVRFQMISALNLLHYSYRCYAETILKAETKDEIMAIKLDF